MATKKKEMSLRERRKSGIAAKRKAADAKDRKIQVARSGVNRPVSAAERQQTAATPSGRKKARSQRKTADLNYNRSLYDEPTREARDKKMAENWHGVTKAVSESKKAADLKKKAAAKKKAAPKKKATPKKTTKKK